MEHPAFPWATRARAVIARSVLLVLASGFTSASIAAASVISTKDATAIAAFKAGRTVLSFDELTVPPGPCSIPLNRNQYAAQGVLISAKADGSLLTNLAQLPACGTFGPTLTTPNIIGGGTGPGSLLWRETVRFDFPIPASAFGANSDWTGSNTTLTAYQSDGSVIASVSGDQGDFMGIEAPGIAYAVWKWNFDQSVAGFSLDNITLQLDASGVPDLASPPSLGSVIVEPNPFEYETTVRWSLPAPDIVRVGVFDVVGRRVATLLDASRPAGEGVVHWNARDDQGRPVPSGVYFVRVFVSRGTISQRVLRLR